jgi:RNA polymerase sigma factor (TIGR02999 family)
MSDIPSNRTSVDAQVRHDADQLLPLVYVELRQLAAARMAAERPDHTLDATALVHEAYLRLGGETSFASKSQFFRAAAVAMQRILVDHARRKRAEKRGGAGQRFELSEGDRVIIPDPDTLLSIDDALTKLAQEDPAAAELARLRLFAGVTVEDACDALGISRATAFRDWAYARAWLSAALSGPEKSENS